MVNQATMNGSPETAGRHSMPSASAVAGNLGDVLDDVTTLAELQAKLIATDLKATARGWIVASILAATGAATILGSVPIILLAATEALIQYADFTRFAATATAAAIGILIAAVALAAGWVVLKSSGGKLSRSKTELQRNIQWMKAIIRNRGRRPRPAVNPAPVDHSG